MSASSTTQVKKVVKKSTTTTTTSTKQAHPKFIDMIVEALKSLNERSGSSRQAMLKFIMSKYQLDEKVATLHVKLAIKNGVKNGSLKQLKGVGPNGSFKIGDAIKNKKTENKKKLVKKLTDDKKGEDKPKKNIKKIVKPKVPKVSDVKSSEEMKNKVTKATSKTEKSKPKIEKVKNNITKTVKKAEIKKKASQKTSTKKTVA